VGGREGIVGASVGGQVPHNTPHICTVSSPEQSLLCNPAHSIGSGSPLQVPVGICVGGRVGVSVGDVEGVDVGVLDNGESVGVRVGAVVVGCELGG
jgi:hypothetical protein